MTDEEKLELIPDKIRSKSYNDFTRIELEFVVSLNFSPLVLAALYNSYQRDANSILKRIEEKYCNK
jgi:hypothetical protein